MAPVRQSNLCLEIALPTKPLQHVHDEEGEIALCTLAAFNLGKLDNLSELEEMSELLVRALDSLLDYQDYHCLPLITPPWGVVLSVSVLSTLANYLAKHGVRYSDGSANGLTHKTFEAIQYYLLKASNRLAKEQGTCTKFNETTYAKGILPVDTYKRIWTKSAPKRSTWTGNHCAPISRSTACATQP